MMDDTMEAECLQAAEALRREAARSLSRVETIQQRIAKFGAQRTAVADEMVASLQQTVQHLEELFPATGNSAAGNSILAAAKEDLEARSSTATRAKEEEKAALDALSSTADATAKARTEIDAFNLAVNDHAIEQRDWFYAPAARAGMLPPPLNCIVSSRVA